MSGWRERRAREIDGKEESVTERDFFFSKRQNKKRNQRGLRGLACQIKYEYMNQLHGAHRRTQGL